MNIEKHYRYCLARIELTIRSSQIKASPVPQRKTHKYDKHTDEAT